MTYTLLHVELFLWSWSTNGYCFTALIVHLRGYIKRRPKLPGNKKKSSLAGVRPLKFDRERQATWLYCIGYLGLTKKDLQIDDCGLFDDFWASFFCFYRLLKWFFLLLFFWGGGVNRPLSSFGTEKTTTTTAKTILTPIPILFGIDIRSIQICIFFRKKTY